MRILINLEREKLFERENDARNTKSVIFPLFGENATHPYTSARNKIVLHATLNFNLSRRALYYSGTEFRRKHHWIIALHFSKQIKNYLS